MSESIIYIHCRKCEAVMKRTESIPQPNGPLIEMFECPTEGCGLRAGVVFEPQGGMTAEQMTWVEAEIARRGSFFPTDWTGNAGGPRRY